MSDVRKDNEYKSSFPAAVVAVQLVMRYRPINGYDVRSWLDSNSATDWR